MLRPLEASEFEAYIDFAYKLALDPARSGYPTYCDGIKTREDFIANVQKTFSRPDRRSLLFTLDGQAEGLIAFECLEEDRYLHPYMFNIRRDTGTALAEFTACCRERWPGFELDMGFPAENAEAITWLEEAGAPCIERSWNYQLFLDRYAPLPEGPAVRRIGTDNFEEFAAIHRRIEEDMYWNCQRTQRNLNDWAIFVSGEAFSPSAGELLMTIDEDPHQEIFALEFADGQYRKEPFRALLAAGLNVLKERGAKYLTFFVDHDFEGRPVLDALGFTLVGGYVCYQIDL